MTETVVLAYSGGLDTSVAIRWINEKYDLDVIAVTVDVGNEKDFEWCGRRRCGRAPSRPTSSTSASSSSRTSSFPRCRPAPCTRACTRWRRRWPAVDRQAIVDVRPRRVQRAVAHGCTGKGNDQVRFDVTVQTLAPDLKIIAPVREWR